MGRFLSTALGINRVVITRWHDNITNPFRNRLGGSLLRWILDYPAAAEFHIKYLVVFTIPPPKHFHQFHFRTRVLRPIENKVSARIPSGWQIKTGAGGSVQGGDSNAHLPQI